MEFLEIAEKIIPGYSLLPPNEQQAFQVSSIGQNFVSLIDKIKDDISHLKHSVNLFSFLFSSVEIKKEELFNNIKNRITEFKKRAQEDEAYLLIKNKCDFFLLAEDFPNLSWVKEDVQKQITDKDYSQNYLKLKIQLEKLLNEARKEFDKAQLWQNQTKIEELTKQCSNAQISWLENFHNDTELFELKNNIELKEINESLLSLAQFFHLLHYRLDNVSLQTELDKLSAAIKLSNKTSAEINQLEKKQLSRLIDYCMEQITQDLQFINLRRFNKEQANLMAEAILQAFNQHEDLNLHELLQRYHQKLKQTIQEQLLFINGVNWGPDVPLQNSTLLNSLSYLLTNPLVNQASEFLRRLSDAHAFIQATGFATQNESSFLAIFDFYNYNRAAGKVAEAKSILTSLLSPFLPLYTEYRDIALYEKSIFWKLYRTIMPVIIAVSFVVVIAALLSPLGLPELAFAAVFVPTLFIGAALATKYVQVKDKLHSELREYYYGGSYEIPEFKINERMLASFGHYDKAQIVREYYIEAIKSCIKLDKFYRANKDKGILTNDDLEEQKTNTEKLNLLYLEWYDIHSNNELSYLATPNIILTRLKNEGNSEYQALKSSFNQELDEINEVIDVTVNDLEETLNPQEQTKLNQETPSQSIPTLPIHYTPKLFKPRCLTHKLKTEEYANLIEAVQPKASY